MAALPSPSAMYESLRRRDPAGEGVFFAAVRTTGIFCRPTCGARTPRAENVEWFRTPDGALRAGYRPCKRCAPLERVRRPPAWVVELLNAVDRSPARTIRGDDLRARSIPPERARRHFQRHYGMTFAAYQRARRLGAARAALREGVEILDAGLAHGFRSASGFHDAFRRLFGVPPGRGREGTVLLASHVPTPLGPLVAVASPSGLALLEYADRRSLSAELGALARRHGATILPGEDPILEATACQLSEFFAGRRTTFDVPLDIGGTPFERSVWTRLLAIPFGTTMSYVDIARGVGNPAAVRAVGRANGRNVISIVVPCHRVVRSDGALSGYAGGVWRKAWLLDHERRALRDAEAARLNVRGR